MGPASSRGVGKGHRRERRRGTGPHPFAAAVPRRSPRVPAPLRSGTATWSSRASGGARQPYVVSHLDHDSAGCETAFPVSRETVLHVGLTLGRGDVMAHASRRRGRYRRHPSPSRGPQTPSGSGKARGGIRGKGSFYARSAVRGRKGARRGRAGWSHRWDRGRLPQRCGGSQRDPAVGGGLRPATSQRRP